MVPFVSGGAGRLGPGLAGLLVVIFASLPFLPLQVLAKTPESESAADLPSLDELLAIDTSLDYDQSKRCLGLHRFDEVRALDEQHIVFEMKGGAYYLVQLERRCSGLRPKSAVAYEHRSSRLCALDRVRGVGVAGGFSPSCQLGRFQPVSEEQIALLEETLKQRAAHRKKRGKGLKKVGSNPQL